MKEKIIQGGIVNGEKMLVCPTWEDEFQKAIHKTGGCFRISMDYSAVDVSWWKELEKIAGKYGYTLIPNRWKSFRNMYRSIKSMKIISGNMERRLLHSNSSAGC